MKGYDKGTVCFDQLIVMGREFFASRYGPYPSFYDYVFSVNPYMSTLKKRKKGDPEHYLYEWSGYINICCEGKSIHLHNVDGDIKLLKQEAKIALLKQTIEEFLKELKAWSKDPDRKEVFVRKWLNPDDSRYTGYVTYHFEKNGAASLSFADCHKSIITWVYSHTDENNVPLKNNVDKALVKHLEELCKGLGKAISAIQNLRKFFEREVFDANEK